MAQVEQQYKRSISYKIFLSDISNLPLVKGDSSTTSNYLEHKSFQISRVNVMGTIIQKQGSTSLAMEDGSSQMQLRVFEDTGLLHSIEIGDVVQVIGRPREYADNRYILPEIVKKINAEWLKVRAKEISFLTDANSNNNSSSVSVTQAHHQTTQKIETTQAKEVDEEDIKESPSETILSYIKNNDRGEGIDIQSIVESRVVENIEKHIQMLLRNGDVFEIRPGRVKVLE